MANRGAPRLRKHQPGRGKPGVPYIPQFPPKPDEGQWFWHYGEGRWVESDPYKDKEGKRG